MSGLDLQLFARPENEAVRLWIRAATLLLDELPPPGSELYKSLDGMRKPAAEALVDWQSLLLQAQIYRGQGLASYVDDLLPPDKAQFAKWVCPLFDVPRGFDDVEGDHPYPLLNWFHQVLTLISRDEMDEETFLAVLDALWDQFADGMKWLATDPDPFRGGRGQKACREVLGALQLLDNFREEPSSRLLTSGAEKFLIACEPLEEVFFHGLRAAYSSGPTGVPVLDWSVHAVAAAGDELYSIDLMEECLRWAYQRTLLSRLEFELAVVPDGSPEGEFQQAMEHCRATLRHLQEALLALLSEPENIELQEERLGQLIQAGKDLAGQIGYFREQASQEGQITCPQCSRSSPSRSRVCDCGATLPRPVESSQETGRDEFFRGLIGACEELLTSETNKAEVGQWAIMAASRFARAQWLVRQVPPDLRLSRQLLEIREQAAMALDDYEQALNHLETYLTNGRLSQLSKCIKALMASAKELRKVRDLWL